MDSSDRRTFSSSHFRAVARMTADRTFRAVLLVVALMMPNACAPAPAPNVDASGVGVPTEAELWREPGMVRRWAERVTAADAKVRAGAATELVEGGEQSVPL